MKEHLAPPIHTAAEQCYANKHLSPALHGFLDVCRSVSKGEGRKHLYFSGEKMADLFHPMGISTGYNYASELVERGWLKVVRPSYTLPNGRKSPTVYYVLTHEEWAAEHPGVCEQLAAAKAKRRTTRQAKKLAASPLQNLEGLESPLQNPCSPLQITSSPLQNPCSPLQNGVGNSYLLTHTNKLIPATVNPATSPDSGVVDSFLRKHLSQTERKRLGATDLRGAATTPESGVVVSNTPVAELRQQAEQLLQPFTRELGIEFGLERTRWIEGVQTLLAHGNSADGILRAIAYAVAKHGEHVRRQLGYGFDAWLKQTQSEMSAEQNTEAA